jgi:hypothetical protein
MNARATPLLNRHKCPVNALARNWIEVHFTPDFPTRSSLLKYQMTVVLAFLHGPVGEPVDRIVTKPLRTAG